MVLLMPKSLRGGHMMPIEISHPIQQMVQEMSQWCRSILDRHFHGNLNRMSDHFNTVLQRHFRDDPFFPVFQRSNVASLVRTNSAHEDGTRLRMKFDMLQFSPNEVSVKVLGNTLVVEASQKEKKEGHSYVRRYFKKRYLLPSGIDAHSFKSDFSSDNILTVTAQKQKDLTNPPNSKTEFIIPVQIEANMKSTNNNVSKETIIPVNDKRKEQSFRAADSSRLSSHERIIPVSISDEKSRKETSKNVSAQETIIPVSVSDVKIHESRQKSSFTSSDKHTTGVEAVPKETIIPVSVSDVKIHNKTSTKQVSAINERIVPVTVEERQDDIPSKPETSSRIIPIQLNETVDRPMRVSDLRRNHFKSKQETDLNVTQDIFSKINEDIKTEADGLKESKEKHERKESTEETTRKQEKPLETVIPVQYDVTKLDMPITSTVSLTNVQSSSGERIIPIQIEERPTEVVKPTQTTETFEIERTHPSQMLQTRDLRSDPVWEMLQSTSRRYKSLLDRVFKHDLKEVVEKFNNAWDVSKSHTDFLTDSSIFSSSAIKEEVDHYDVKIDVKNFTPEQLTVKVFNNCVYVEGKHEEKKEDTGFVSRHFSRKYQLPAHVDEWKIKCELTRDGLLVVTAPKTSVESSICHERIIPITLPTDDSRDRGVIIREMSVCSSGTAPSDYEVDMSV